MIVLAVILNYVVILFIPFFSFFSQISGEFSNVQDALYNATGRLRDNLFGGTQNSTGTRSLSSVRADTSPYGRLTDVPLGSQSSLRADTNPYARLRDVSLVGQSSLQADTSPYVRLRDVPLGGQSSLQADTSPYGRPRDVRLGGQSAVGISHSLSRHTFSQGMDHFSLSRNYDRPSSPGLWTPPVSLFLSRSACVWVGLPS